MKKILKKMHEKFGMFPITLLIFSGIYEMFIGDMMRGIMNRNVTWIIPVTQTMIVDTVITMIVIFLLVNGAPKQYKRLSQGSKTKTLSSIILAVCIIIAIILFAAGKIYLTKVMFKLNYPIFMGVLFLICILQKVLEEFLYPDRKKADDRDHSILIDDSNVNKTTSDTQVMNREK